MNIIKKIYNFLFKIKNKNIKINENCGKRIYDSLYSDLKSSITIGNSSARDNCHIEAKNGGKIVIGNNVNFNYNCIVVSHASIEFGNNVSVGPNVIIYDHDHDYKDLNWRKKFICKDVKIGNNVWIGGNVIILKGTIIDDNCVIAAGSILKGEHIKNNSIVYNKIEMVVKDKYEKNK